MSNNTISIRKHYLWETSVFEVNMPNIDNEKITELYYEMQKKDPTGKTNSNEGGYQVFIRPWLCDELDKLLLGIEQAASDIYNEGWKTKYKLKVSNCWFNGNNFGDNNVVHTHPGATLSGVYYLTDGEPEHGMINFVRDNQNSIISGRQEDEEHEPISNDNEICYNTRRDFTAKASKALIFGPWLQHYVTTNRTKETRIVIGLNFEVAGLL
jgi:uncharacterized protein (TIGR02466 family)